MRKNTTRNVAIGLSLFLVMGLLLQTVFAGGKEGPLVYLPIILNGDPVDPTPTPTETPTSTPRPYSEGACGDEGTISNWNTPDPTLHIAAGFESFWATMDWGAINTGVMTHTVPTNNRAVLISQFSPVQLSGVPMSGPRANVYACSYRGDMPAERLAQLMGNDPSMWLCSIDANGGIACNQPGMPTATPTATATLTPTVTATMTATGTVTPTNTPTSTMTPSPTFTPSPTHTPSPTNTPTVTPTPTEVPYTEFACGPVEGGGILENWYTPLFSTTVTATLHVESTTFWTTSDWANVVTGSDSFQIPENERAFVNGYMHPVVYQDIVANGTNANIWGCQYMGELTQQRINELISPPYWFVEIAPDGQITATHVP